MANAVVTALRQAAERVGRILTEDASRAVEGMYRDAGRRTEAVVERVAKADEEQASKLLEIAERIGAKEAESVGVRDLERGADLNVERAALRKRFEGLLGPLDTGSIDESSKAFDPKEGRIARLLESEGHEVSSVLESTEPRVRTPDSLVDGVPTEFKSLQPGATAASVKNDLTRAKGQARDAILDARGSGLSYPQAYEGIGRFLKANGIKRMRTIRILGDGYEIHFP